MGVVFRLAFAALVGVLVPAVAEDRPSPLPPLTFEETTQPSGPHIIPDVPDPRYEELKRKLEACEKGKQQQPSAAAFFHASACPQGTTPVYCHPDGRTMSFVGDPICWASILNNCSAERRGKVFCGTCQPPAHAQPRGVISTGTHGGGYQTPVIYGRPTYYCGSWGRWRRWCR